ncbi:MAG: hypothetical protein RPR28_03170 [Cycloclasticus sp.]
MKMFYTDKAANKQTVHNIYRQKKATHKGRQEEENIITKSKL